MKRQSPKHPQSPSRCPVVSQSRTSSPFMVISAGGAFVFVEISLGSSEVNHQKFQTTKNAVLERFAGS